MVKVRDSRVRDNGQITRNAEGTGCFVRDSEKFEIARLRDSGCRLYVRILGKTYLQGT